MKKAIALFLVVLAIAVPAMAQVRVEDADVVITDQLRLRDYLTQGATVELQMEDNGWFPRERGNCHWLTNPTVAALVGDMFETAGILVGPTTEQILRENARRLQLEGAEFVRRDSSRIQRGTMNVPPLICVITTGGDGGQSGAAIGGSYRGNEAVALTVTAASEAFISLEIFASDMTPLARVTGRGKHKSNNLQAGGVGLVGGFFSRLLGVKVFEVGYVNTSSPLERAARFSTANALRDAGEKLKKIVGR